MAASKYEVYSESNANFSLYKSSFFFFYKMHYKYIKLSVDVIAGLFDTFIHSILRDQLLYTPLEGLFRQPLLSTIPNIFFGFFVGCAARGENQSVPSQHCVRRTIRNVPHKLFDRS